MPRGARELREIQSGHWDDSCDAKRSTSPNRSQIWNTVWQFSNHSPSLSFCLNRKSAARLKTPGKWTALRERKACSGCTTVKSLGDLCQIPPLCCPCWLSHDTFWEGGKINQYQEDGSELQAVYVPGEELHIKKVWKQLRDTLIRQVAGPLERILNRLIHQRNGLMWSNPRGSIGEAAALRPRSLWQVLTERLWPSFKRAKHALKMEIRAGARRACIWTESKWTPKNKVCREVVRTLFLVFVLRPRARMWRRTISLW